MKTKFVALVVPVYNVENYVSDCIISIINQSYESLEIILVDDGSTDNSGLICDEYAKKDNRIRVVHQENQGLSSARNTGIEIAKSQYITFIDSDDYIAPNYIEELYKGVQVDGVLMSVCGYACVDEQDDYREIINHYRNTELAIKVIDKISAIKEVYNRRIQCMDFVAVAKLYDISLFKTSSIRFPIGKLHEDAFTTYKLFYISENISYVDVPLYYYRMRSGSITKSGFSKRKLDKLIATKEECDFFYERNEIELLELAFFDHLHEMKRLIREMENDKKNNGQYINNVTYYMRRDIKKYGVIINIPIVKKTYYELMTIFPELAKLK